MSLMERIKGIWGGIKVGVKVPVLVPLTFMETSGSGPGPAIAVFFAGVAVFLGGFFLLSSIPLAAMLSSMGAPWFVTVPVAYFAGWGLIGFAWKIKP